MGLKVYVLAVFSLLAILTACSGAPSEPGPTPSKNADLASLEPSQGTLEPAFSASVSNYSLSVPNTTSSITVTASVAQQAASLTINNQAVASGVASQPISLTVGKNDILIVVTAQDGSTTKTTTISATRQAATTAPGTSLWLQQFGTDGSDQGRAVTIDSSDNILIAGNTVRDLEDEDKSNDVFLRKLDSDGKLLWTRQFGSDFDDFAAGVAVDASDNVIIAGYTKGALEGDNAGGEDVFVRKYDADGAVVWTRQFGTANRDLAVAVAVDAAGAILVGGSTNGVLGGSAAGLWDAFVRKYDASGNVIWTRQLGTSANDFMRGVAVDNAGNILLSGQTRGVFEGSNAGGDDVFLQKLDPDGELIWTRQFGTPAADLARGVAVDSSANVLVIGNTTGDLGAANAGDSDVFIRKYDADGTVLWTRQFGTSADDNATGVAADSSGNILMVGYTEGALEGTSAGNEDIFIRKYTADGSLSWTRQFGSSSSDVAWAVASDSLGNAVITGSTEGTLQTSNAGDEDAFVVKLSP